MVTLDITDGPRKGEQVSSREVTRHGKHRQVHTLTSRTDLAAAEVCGRMSARWREEYNFRYARTHFALDAPRLLPRRLNTRAGWAPNPAKKAGCARVRRAEPPPARRKPLVTPRCSGCAPPPQDRP